MEGESFSIMVRFLFSVVYGMDYEIDSFFSFVLIFLDIMLDCFFFELVVWS